MTKVLLSLYNKRYVTKDNIPSTFTMVRAFALLCKLNSYKLSDKAIFDAFMTRLDLFHQTCPYCGSHSNHQFHSSYERNMISFINGSRMDYTVSIPRIRCSCGHTHAVLPDILIPYGSYSLRFILLILCQYLTRSCTIEQFCDKYQISQSTLYSWIHQFLEQFNLLAGILRTIDELSADAIEWICAYDGLTMDFYNRFRFSFMQYHSFATLSDTA